MVFSYKRASFGPELQVSMGPSLHLSFCVCKTAWLASESLVSIGPNSHLWLLYSNRAFWTRLTCLCWSLTPPVVLACKRATSGPEYQVSIGPRPHLSFCACKTASLASELLGSMGASLHLWRLQAKQRLLDQNDKCLWVPALTCVFVHVKQRF